MKQLLILAAALLVFVYVTTSFFMGSFDLGEWNSTARAMAGLVSIQGGIGLVMWKFMT